MFDFTTVRSRRAPRVSLFTTLTAVILHAAAVMIIAVTALSATEVVPVARSIPAFMAAAAPPPPPPPPQAVREAPRKASARKTRPAVIKPAPVLHPPARAAGAAPVEAPSEILPETEFAPDTVAFDFDIVSEHGVTGGIPGGIAGGIGETNEVIVPSPPPAPRARARGRAHCGSKSGPSRGYPIPARG